MVKPTPRHELRGSQTPLQGRTECQANPHRAETTQPLTPPREAASTIGGVNSYKLLTSLCGRSYNSMIFGLLGVEKFSFIIAPFENVVVPIVVIPCCL